MKTGDLIIIHRKFNWKRPISYLSAIIRWMTDFYWNHTETAYVENYIYTVGAHGRGIKLQDWQQYISDPDLTYKLIELPEIEKSRILNILHVRYDISSLIFYQLIFQLTRKITGKGLWLGPSEEKSYNKLYCSEAHAYLRGLKGWYKMSTRELVQALAPDVFEQYRLDK